MSRAAAASDVETGERQRTQHEASASTATARGMLTDTESLRKAFISMCCGDLVRSSFTLIYGIAICISHLCRLLLLSVCSNAIQTIIAAHEVPMRAWEVHARYRSDSAHVFSRRVSQLSPHGITCLISMPMARRGLIHVI